MRPGQWYRGKCKECGATVMGPKVQAERCPVCNGELVDSTLTIGFTGTRRGMSRQQRAEVMAIIQQRQPSGAVHGDCIGADDDFDSICAALSVPRGIRPCTFADMRAHCERRGARVVAEPEPPMARNRAIIADIAMLIACPPNYTRVKKGSGTWATIGFAERARVGSIIVFPNGMRESNAYMSVV